MFERSVLGIAHTAPDGHWLRVNQRLCELLGYTRDELAVRTFHDVTHPDDVDDSVAHLKQLLVGGRDADEWDKRYIRKDGAVIWVHLTVSLVRTPTGEPDYFISMVQDITDRKQLEHDRSQSLERERTARLEAEAARVETDATNAQLRAMQALTDTALSHLSLDDLLAEVLDRVTAVMGVDNVAILLLDDDGRALTMRAARGRLEQDVGRVRIPVGRGFAGRIAASRAPLVVNDTSAFDTYVEYPQLRQKLHSVAGVPLLVEDPLASEMEGHPVSRLVGVIHVGCTTPRRFTEADVQLLHRAADRIALAIERVRLYAAERHARQRAEEALARALASEAQATARAEQLHTILETMADGVAVYDAEGRPIQMVNHAYRELFALERGPEEYEALTTFERARLVQVRGATGAPLPFDATPIGRALHGEVVDGPEADIRARAFDGRELEVNSSAAPLRDPDGHVTGAVLVLRDMTERNRLAREREEAYRQAERQAEQLDRVFEAAAEGLLVWDAEGRLVRVNPAARRMLGLDAAPTGYFQLPLSERLARYGARLQQGRPTSTEDCPLLRSMPAALVNTEDRTDSHDLRLRSFDGRELEVNGSTAPLRDREGNLVGLVCVVHDVTERNRLAREREAARADELAAREASRRLEQFLATAAHDLRSPLAATVGFLDLAQHQTERLASAMQQASPELAPRVDAVRGRLDDAAQGADRLTRLLAVLFDTAAIRAGKLELHRAPCDPLALVRAQVEAIRVAAPERTIQLHAPEEGLDDAPIAVEADADRIGEVLTNYLTNALKYSPPDRPVAVSIEVRKGRARVAVCDQGTGIPKAEQVRVWEPFHRASEAKVQDGAAGGTQRGSLGLGLHISKAIIQAHGGRVGVKSAVGQGSTFWFSLPLSAPQSNPDGTATES
jgi:PAS domain S-box-containing protein